jgi:lipopolysaccharide biosynthesis glycosyltransferase
MMASFVLFVLFVALFSATATTTTTTMPAGDSVADFLRRSSDTISVPSVSIRFAQPKQGSLVLTSSVTVQLVADPPDFDMLAHGVFFCLDLLYRHGTERRCIHNTALPWMANIDGLQQGTVQIIATLERNATTIGHAETAALPEAMGSHVAADPWDSAELETHVLAQTRVSFDVVMRENPEQTMQISFPRPNEHLSTGSVDVAMRVGGFRPASSATDLEDDGSGGDASSYFCTSFVENLNHPTLEKTHNRCIVPEHNEIVLSTKFSTGLHGISARLYGSDGVPLGGPASSTSTVFRITETATGYRPGAPHWPNPLGDYQAEDDAISALAAPASPLPVIHLAVTSYRSFNRYKEALLMFKSMLLHRGSSNIVHLHLIVDTAGQQFFERELLSLNVSCLRVSFHAFDSVCKLPNEAFLAKYNWQLSAHYSGVAGYCRIYLFDWFHKLGIDSIIAIESDQLFVQDVSKLWAEFARFGKDAVMGLPELYKPWREGRSTVPAADPAGAARRIAARNIEDDEQGGTRAYRRRHNGYIGGIVMLNLTRMSALAPSWDGVMHASLDTFLAKEWQTDPDWTLEMNDQDVINAMAEVRPELFHSVSCQWQIQFHAYKEHQRICGRGWEDIESSCKASHDLGMFLCRRPAALIHFMAQSYKTRGGLATMWRSVRDLPWSMALHDRTNTCGV